MKIETTIEWDDTSYRTDEGVLVSSWTSEDGRFTIDLHPNVPKYLLADRGRYAGIHASFKAAERAAIERTE